MNLEEKIDLAYGLVKKANKLDLEISFEINRRGVFIHHFVHTEDEAILIQNFEAWKCQGEVKNHETLSKAITYLINLIKEKAPQGLASE